jgi:hypothetical protein
MLVLDKQKEEEKNIKAQNARLLVIFNIRSNF